MALGLKETRDAGAEAPRRCTEHWRIIDWEGVLLIDLLRRFMPRELPCSGLRVEDEKAEITAAGRFSLGPSFSPPTAYDVARTAYSYPTLIFCAGCTN